MSKSKINWAEIMEAKRDEIESAIKKAKGETEGCMQGWHVDVEIDENEVWVTGLISQGSQSQSSWNGTSYIVTSINSWNPEIQESELIKNDEKLYQKFLDQQEDEDGFEYAYEFLNARYPEIVKEWIQEAIEFEINELNAYEIIDEAIENYNRYNSER